MRKYLYLCVPLFLPAFLLLTSSGCGKKDDKTTTTTTTGKVVNKATPDVPLEGDLVGVLEGKITYAGDPPDLKPPADLAKNKDCLAGAADYEKKAQQWIVGTDGAVADAVVYLKPPKGKYFKYDESKLKPKDTFIDQPHCAFIPHVQVVFPAYTKNGLDRDQKTGQVFVVQNSAPFTHNSKVDQPGEDDFKSAMNPVLSAKSKDVIDKTKPIEFIPSYENPGVISCTAHPWMNAKVWAFDHPYAVRTDMDGKFKIENIPVGVELEVYVWHDGIETVKTTKTFKKGATETYSPTIKAK